MRAKLNPWLLACIGAMFVVLTSGHVAAQSYDTRRTPDLRRAAPPPFPTLSGGGPVFVAPAPNVSGGPDPSQVPIPGFGEAGGGMGSGPFGMSKGRFETEPYVGKERR